MNRTLKIAALLLTTGCIAACSPGEPTETEVSTVTDEGPYGGYSVQWYKVHWNVETKDQRRWCQQQEERSAQMKSCLDAAIGWKQGWGDPKTNTPRQWDDGPKVD